MDDQNLRTADDVVLDAIREGGCWFIADGAAYTIAEELAKQGLCRVQESRYMRDDDGEMKVVYRYVLTPPPSSSP